MIWYGYVTAWSWSGNRQTDINENTIVPILTGMSD